MAEIQIDDILKAAVRIGSSDIHLKAGSPPAFRVNGELIFVKEAPQTSPEDMRRIALSMMNIWQKEKLRQIQ
jgi:Tfp pilus assembly protein, pilus retraction ATPase PilT